MSWPDIVFSEEDKAKFRALAIALEQELEIESQNSKEIEKFAKYPPLVEAINLAKGGNINSPLEISNMGYWYFESPLSEWFHFSKSKVRQTLSDFIRLISGFPLMD